MSGYAAVHSSVFVPRHRASDGGNRASPISNIDVQSAPHSTQCCRYLSGRGEAQPLRRHPAINVQSAGTA